MPSANSSLSHSLVISLSSPSVPSPVAAASRASWEKRWRTFKVEERKKKKTWKYGTLRNFHFFLLPPPTLLFQKTPASIFFTSVLIKSTPELFQPVLSWDKLFLFVLLGKNTQRNGAEKCKTPLSCYRVAVHFLQDLVQVGYSPPGLKRSMRYHCKVRSDMKRLI